MSKLISTIDQDLKQAMREKKEFERDVLRMLVSALRNKKIELYGNNNKDLNDEEALAVIKSEIKKRKDSIASYKQGERNDLVENEEKELKIIEKYMPEQLSEEEARNIIKKILEPMGELQAKDFGRTMGAVMTELKNKVDGNVVSKILKEILK